MKQKVFEKILLNDTQEEHEKISKLNKEHYGSVYCWIPEYETTQDFVNRIQKFAERVTFPKLQYNSNFNECIVIYEDETYEDEIYEEWLCMLCGNIGVPSIHPNENGNIVCTDCANKYNYRQLSKNKRVVNEQ